MPQLSVIVPIFNSASYLDECLSSIVNQTFKDFEVICINDGSTDESLTILKEWAKKDHRVKVISQENKGNSSARNAGLIQAKGQYITFVDSDDIIKTDMYESLVTKMEESRLDAIGCAYKTYPILKLKKFKCKTNDILTFNELLTSNKEIQSSNDLCFCWRYMFRKEILKLNNITFNENITIGEDMIFVIEVISHCKKIYLTNEPFYYYRIDNKNSLMNSRKYNPHKATSYNLMYLTKVDQIKRLGINNYTPYSDDLAKYSIYNYLPFLIQNEYCNKNKENRKNNIKEIYSLPMIRESFQRVGFKNIYPTWKEYVFYLIQKFSIMPLIMDIYNRFYERTDKKNKS